MAKRTFHIVTALASGRILAQRDCTQIAELFNEITRHEAMHKGVNLRFDIELIPKGNERVKDFEL